MWTWRWSRPALDAGSWGEIPILSQLQHWGGAPASGVVLTDTLPAEVHLISASDPPDSIIAIRCTGTSRLARQPVGGQIQLLAEIDQSGTVINTAAITSTVNEPSEANNMDSHIEYVDDILPPIILRPTGVR